MILDAFELSRSRMKLGMQRCHPLYYPCHNFDHQQSEAASSMQSTAKIRPTLSLRQPFDGILCIGMVITRIMS